MVTPIDIVAPASQLHLVFGQIPVGSVAGKAVKGKIVVYVEDASGKIIKNDKSSITLASNGQLTGKTTRKVKNGKAVFSGLEISSAGTFTLTAADGDDILASAPITVTAAPARPKHHSRKKN